MNDLGQVKDVDRVKLAQDSKVWWLLRGEEIQLGRRIDELNDLEDDDDMSVGAALHDLTVAYDLIMVTMQKMLDADPVLAQLIKEQSK